MSDTMRLALPRIYAGQAQKHVTHNEALGLIDALMHLSVRARNVNAPPQAPQAGERVIVGAQASGAFAGKVQAIAAFEDGAWIFLTPKRGWRAFVESENRLFVFDGSNWVALSIDISEVQNLNFAGIGTRADAANPLSVRANAALFTAIGPSDGGTGDLRFKLNKAAPASVVSQLYQTNWGGRAETGLIGDDQFRIKVSANGGTWNDALYVDAASGRVFFPNGASDLQAAAAITTGTGAVYLLNAPLRGPLAEGALIWFVPHVPNAGALDTTPTLQIANVDATALPLRHFDGANLPQGALEAGRAVCVRKVGSAYHVQFPGGTPAFVNLLEDGGRFAGSPEPAAFTVAAFEDPAYLASLNGATRASFGIARQNSSSFGGSAAALPQAIADLCSRMRTGAALTSGVEFAVLQVTAGAGTQAGTIVQTIPYYPPLSLNRPFGRAATFGIYFRLVSGSAILAPDASPRVLVDGVPHNHLANVATRVFNAASGWRHVQHWIGSPGGASVQGFPLRVTPGTVLLLALPVLVAGHVTLPWDIGACPSARLWR